MRGCDHVAGPGSNRFSIPFLELDFELMPTFLGCARQLISQQVACFHFLENL